MVKRELYLAKIRPFYDISLIKVIVGIRRCGKSELLKQIMTEIRLKTTDDHILYIPLDREDFFEIRTYQALSDYIHRQIKDDALYYLFFDEIQLVEHFEKTLNSLKSYGRCSIFVTGSNSRLLSNELSTLMSGRYVTFHMQPFSYQESLAYLSELNRPIDEQTFYDFCLWGSLPQRFEMRDESSLRVFLDGVYTSVVLHDIIERARQDGIKIHPPVLKKIIAFLLQNTGQIFSSKNVFNVLRANDSSIQADEVYQVVDYVVGSFCVSRCSRYDLRGKRILAFYDKYYATDLGLLTIQRTTEQRDMGAILETVVYNELISRGYQVTTGKTYKSEIDFIVLSEGKKCYIQVAYLLADQATINREFGAYAPVRDAFPKHVLSLDKFDLSRDGIVHLNLIDFLTGKKNLIFG